jgi:pentose-5-phosphate-3-epimerase
VGRRGAPRWAVRGPGRILATKFRELARRREEVDALLRMSPLTDEQRLQMDGSISERNARQMCESGCDVLVAATGIFACPPHERARGWGR